MISAAQLARFDHRLRRSLTRLPAHLAVGLYSRGRRGFLERFSARPSLPPVQPPEALRRTVWGLEFPSPVMNAAGMFKNGEALRVVAAQGAGAYLAGSTTLTPRRGNRRHGIATPFVPYPRSGAASNWLGLPNPGHRVVAERLAVSEREPGMPVGISLAMDSGPEAPPEPLHGLVEGMELFAEAGVDFIEFNESCPNTEDDEEDDAHTFDAFAERLRHVSGHFLRHRSRRLPVLVKLSVDTEPERLPRLVDLLVELGFDGLVLGNTSIAYDRLRAELHPGDRRLFDHFSSRFGGGVSGRPLRGPSLALVREAKRHLEAKHRDADFHLVRVGGVENAEDVAASLQAGASLVQWYTGYFEAFARHGHALYAELYIELERRLARD